MSRKLFRITLLIMLVGAGIWAVVRATQLKSETIARQEAVQALAPGQNRTGAVADSAAADDEIVRGTSAAPVVVDINSVPHRASDVDRMYEEYINGEREIEANEGPFSESIFAAQVAESLRLGVDKTVQNYDGNQANGSLLTGASFKSIDYTQSQQGVPPDPELMVGTNHVVVSVNTSFAVYNKSGQQLIAPTLFDDFWNGNCGTGSNNMVLFDPFSTYDESAHRYVLGITGYDSAVNGGNNGWACIAVSQTDSATGNWNLYSFDGNPGTGTDYFLDYPHIGTGQQALYLAANMFGTFAFVRNHVFAFDKNAMYNGQTANFAKVNVASTYFNLSPADLKAYNFGGWPTNPNEPHYFVEAKNGNSNLLRVFAFSDPWGSPAVNLVATLTVNSYSQPISQPQAGTTAKLQANDDRILDVEYVGGRLWANHAIACNPGGGSVDCLRWYEINTNNGGTPSLVQQGTFSSAGDYRSFPDLAVDACGDMLIGYTKTNSSIYPGVYVAGREASDPSGQLKSETTQHAGEAYYTAYDPQPHRWGDYTGMTLDPDGKTFWYLGEYSRNQATARWSTWVGSYSWSSCNPNGGPTPTPPPGPTPTPPPGPTPTPPPGGCTDLIQNGDFELGQQVWIEQSSHNYTLICADGACGNNVPPHSGTYLAWLGGGNNETSVLVQPWRAVPAGQPATLNFYNYVSSTDACGYDKAAVLAKRQSGGGFNLLTYIPLCSSNNSTDWVLESIDMSAYAGDSVMLVFYTVTDGTLSSSWFVDDVSLLTGNSCVASPASPAMNQTLSTLDLNGIGNTSDAKPMSPSNPINERN